MSILITGGMGALGSSVARLFVDKGETPVLYDMFEDYTLIDDLKKQTIFVKGDILDQEKIAEVIKEYGINTIIHTVSLLSAVDPKKMIPVNTRGTELILWSALDGNVKRVVYISSKGVYNVAAGEYSHPLFTPIDEEYPKDQPMGIYGATKFYCELLGNAFSSRYGLEFVSLRFSTIYGPGRLLKNPNSPMVLPCRIIENAMLGKPFTWPFGGEQKDDFIYYDDVAQGVFLASTVPTLKSRVYNIGTGKGYTLNDFAVTTKKRYPTFEANIGPGLNHTGSKNPSYSIYDISRAKKELGYNPQCDIDTGVSRYVEAMERLKITPTYVP